ncbi:MAG: hypothetical protein LUB59_05460, partial [Candidatus Gastranaerophilales bacterium]|nr:hypothetical protein [Candidatus Gastranaerophilales bacterium]
YYDIIQKKPQYRMKIMPLYWRLCDARNEVSKYENRELLEATLNSTKEEKNANCCEFSRMAKAAFIANGFKDVRTGSLRRMTKPNEHESFEVFRDSEKCDHRVLIVNAGKNADLKNLSTLSKHAMIVDPWCGAADYVSNVLTKFKGIFLRDIDNQEKSAACKFLFEEKDKFSPNDKTCKYFADKFPELVVSK